MDEKDRIEKVMLTEGMNSAQFAAEIGIQGSTLSHILNGRNNPSLDVLKKVLNRFRTVSSDWLILGVGSMYRSEKQAQTPTLFDSINENSSKSAISEPKIVEKVVSPSDVIQQNTPQIPAVPVQPTSEARSIIHSVVDTPAKSVRKIIVYYTDNTFQEFETK
jgi:transcriptional regulator with XRE-family HTH domain